MAEVAESFRRHRSPAIQPFGQNQVVQARNAQKATSPKDSLCDFDILWGWLRVTAGMVVSEDHRTGIEPNSMPVDLTGIDDGKCVCATGEDHGPDWLTPPVQVESGEAFIFLAASDEGVQFRQGILGTANGVRRKTVFRSLQASGQVEECPKSLDSSLPESDYP